MNEKRRQRITELLKESGLRDPMTPSDRLGSAARGALGLGLGGITLHGQSSLMQAGRAKASGGTVPLMRHAKDVGKELVSRFRSGGLLTKALIGTGALMMGTGAHSVAKSVLARHKRSSTRGTKYTPFLRSAPSDEPWG